MSDTGTPASPAAQSPPAITPAASDAPPVSTAPEPPVTEIDIPADGGYPADPAPEPPKDAAPTEPASKADPEPQPRKKSPYQQRIDALTAQRDGERKRAEEAIRQAELYKAMVDGKAPLQDDPSAPAAPAPVFGSKDEFDRAVAAEAERRAASTVVKSRTDNLLKSGNAEFKDFNDRCNELAALGAGDRADFMQIITDPDIIPDGHKVIAQLADKPEEAARIFSLPTVQMTAALVKFHSEQSKPTSRPVSSAPAPITPISGMSRGSDEPNDNDSMAEYARKYRAKQAEKLKGSQPSRFARH